MRLLYHNWNSTCSQKVRICLAEKHLAWESRHLNLRRFDQLLPEFLALNPGGMVPVLVEDGRVLAESRLINEYLEEAHPGLPLAPADPFERWRMRVWTRYVDDTVSEAIKIPSFIYNIRPQAQRLSDTELARVMATMPDKHAAERWRKVAREGFSRAEVQPSLDRFDAMLERMDAALASSSWLAGPHYSLADIDIAPFVYRLERIELGHLIAARPRVADWYSRIRARPAFIEAMAFADPEAGGAKVH